MPEVGKVHQINNQLPFGIGAFGVSDMGVDYRNLDPSFSYMNTTFQFMRIIPALSYNHGISSEDTDSREYTGY